ncbi:Uncharacterized conserved protein, DUF58 family, contains vWF domain [Marinobacter antarcticus]|uniref:Uncharacterized conserved protein, DUF58 family, contains vWF domain n=1 Tax=Marinobacter antarcticus TaxID=564117 RepID=A0A1M6SQM6_9GAMM|nr:DUF58 domain-containing protein [Marinobacter antarcticus]SHK46888.1 Uncharacterized conserved protein, DUF58 family, contains vWF domain [Marinobacter antarcticus]
MNRIIRSRWQRWINRRIPRSDVQLLTQRNLFILPTAAGVVFGMLLLIMLITGINYQNSLIYLVTFLLGAVFVGAMHQTHRNLAGLELTLVQAGEGFAGDEILFRLRAAAGKDDAIALTLSSDDVSVRVGHVPSGQSVDIALPVPSAYRGYLRPDQIRIETRFPFGLLKAWSWMRPVSAAVVFPRPIAAPEVSSAVEDGDQTASSRSPEGNDHAELRPWREGDMSQRVMWKRFVRSGQMVVADWEADKGSPQWLDFNAFPGTDHELRLSYLSWLVLERSKSGARFGLNLPGQVIEPDSGPAHTTRCHRALAIWGEKKPRDALAEPHGTRSYMDPGKPTNATPGAKP